MEMKPCLQMLPRGDGEPLGFWVLLNFYLRRLCEVKGRRGRPPSSTHLFKVKAPLSSTVPDGFDIYLLFQTPACNPMVLSRNNGFDE